MMIRYPRVPALHDELYCKLVDQLFGTLGAWTAGVVGSLTMASAGVVIDGRPRFVVCLCALAAAALIRGFVLVAYKRSRHDKTDARAVRRWEYAYAIPAVLWMSAVGVDAYFSMSAPSMLLRIFASVMAIGITGGIAGRNASRPWIVIAQVIAVLTPYAAALVQIGTAPYFALLAMTTFMFLGVKSSTQSFYDLLLSAMTNAQRNTFLANRFDTALNNMSHGLVMFDGDLNVEVVNERFKELLGIPSGRVTPGSTLRDVIEAACEHRTALARTTEDYVELFEARVRTRCRESMPLKAADGTMFDFRFHPTGNGGTVIMVEDVTEKKNAAAKIERMAHYDDLTGLPNRAMIMDILAANVSDLEIEGKRPFSVLYLDLDHFKQINDTLGHSIGDALLSLVSERIKAAIRTGDICARLAGDEFVVVQFTEGDEDASACLAERLIKRVSAPYAIDGKEVIVGLSVGIAKAAHDGTTAEDLLKNADLALYRAKEQGKGTFCSFKESMNVDAKERREREFDLRRAIENDDISVFFQPIVDLPSERVTSCEALVRWFHPTKNMIPPDEFIKLAEATGLIVDLGAVVLRKACIEAIKWPTYVSVAVNLSAVQFRRGVVVDQIKEALELSGLPADRLEVEITESLALSNLPAIRQVLEQVRNLGVKVALDDFGTGYSSLAYLQQIPFDKIKIDRSFVGDLAEDGMSRALIRLMTSFVRTLDKVLVVEGVETPEQVSILREMGVQQLQGYFFSKPKPAAELGNMTSLVSRIPTQLRMVA